MKIYKNKKKKIYKNDKTNNNRYIKNVLLNVYT